MLYVHLSQLSQAPKFSVVSMPIVIYITIPIPLVLRITLLSEESHWNHSFVAEIEFILFTIIMTYDLKLKVRREIPLL